MVLVYFTSKRSRKEYMLEKLLKFNSHKKVDMSKFDLSQ